MFNSIQALNPNHLTRILIQSRRYIGYETSTTALLRRKLSTMEMSKFTDHQGSPRYLFTQCSIALIGTTLFGTLYCYDKTIGTTMSSGFQNTNCQCSAVSTSKLSNPALSLDDQMTKDSQQQASSTILSTSSTTTSTSTSSSIVSPSTRTSQPELEESSIQILRMSREPRLDKKVAVITGASRGLGQAIALRFVQEGAHVILLDLLDCNETLQQIGQIQRSEAADRSSDADDDGSIQCMNAEDVAVSIKCDISDETQVQNAIQTAMAEQKQLFGNDDVPRRPPKIDILVNNACSFVFQNVEDATVDDWMKSMKVNILGHALVTKHCLPYMKKQPSSLSLGCNSSSIIFQGSISSLIGQPNCATYATMKGAIIQLSRNCAYDLAKYNIRVNTICAGTIETPISRVERQEHNWTFEQWSTLKTQTTLLQRVGTPMEIANVAVFLANSNESSYITGTHIMVDGGQLSCGTVVN